MSHALDEAMDTLNHPHLVDCDDPNHDGDCNCDDVEASCAA